ncbi:MAG: biotin--[acetyl-CoA-carboxylase] ligase [Anaerolineae bacterium]
MDLAADRLHEALGARPFEFHKQISSTNDRAMAWLSASVADGAVVLADEQTQGRGRMARVWYAPPGSALMLSYVLRPSPDALGFVGMMGALAVCEAVDSFGVHTGIKWPNDVQIDGRKLCGVLPEAAWQGETLVGAVLGIGINVRVDFSATPLAATAISLEDAVGAVDRLDLLLRLLDRLDDWSARLASDALFERWRERLVMLGRRVSVAGAKGGVEGVAEAVDRQGALLVRDDGGTLRRMIAGDIRLG